MIKTYYMKTSTQLITILLFWGIDANAQQPDKKNKLSLFFEKVYLHTDRPLYSSGDDIWFAAYLVNGQTNQPATNSNNLYVELISPESQIMSREVVRLENGTGSGDFRLKDSIAGGTYRIRAYTKWMLNFGETFVFEKTIEVNSLPGIKPNLPETKVKAGDVDVRFFPESGSLVEEIPGIVAFKAVDATGKSCNVRGAVVNSKEDTVLWFKGLHLGMGAFNIVPLPGETYRAVGKANGYAFDKVLPRALATGFNMHITQSDSMLNVQISANAATLESSKDKTMTLQGICRSKLYLHIKIKAERLPVTIPITKSTFPGGIVRFTLSEAKKPHCERLVYLDTKEKVNLNISTDKTTYHPRDSVIIKIKSTDKNNQPVATNLSLAITDASQVPNNNGSIVSYLNLESEIRGKIELPQQYFDTTNVNRHKQLDLLLLTQGWRDFVWRRITDSLQRIKYLPEQGFTISGRVRKRFFDKPVDGANVSFTMLGAKKDKFRSLTTDSTGKYYFDGVNFYGSKRLTLLSKNKKGNNTGWILIDSLWQEPIPISIAKNYQQDSSIQKFIDEIKVSYNTLKKYRLKDTIQLHEVQIKGKRTRKEEQEIEHYAFAKGLIDFDFTIAEKDYGLDLISYLLMKLPKATTNAPDGYRSSNHILLYPFPGTPCKTCLFRRPALVLNGMQLYSEIRHQKLGNNFPFSDLDSDNDGIEDGDFVSEDRAYQLSLEEIERIIVSSWAFNPEPLIDEEIVVGGYTVSIYTKPGFYKKKELFYKQTVQLKGYYQAREFFSPKYSKPQEIEKLDLRTTIFWKPNIVTDSDGEATVTFFNADQTAKVRIIAEGISDRGIALMGKGEYEVK
jgi:hypothetical protein